MALQTLLQIVLRWKKPAFVSALLSTSVFLTVAFYKPLTYEAEILIERKPIKTTSTIPVTEFDLTRLTSDMQRSIALLKSRYVLEKWVDTLTPPADTDRQREKRIRKLEKSLIIRPVNYTDLVMVRVRAATTDLAKQRLKTLMDIYADWDQQQIKEEADQIVALLTVRMQKARNSLADLRANVVRLKRSQSLRLSSSSEESALLTEVAGKERLYDALATEMEEAERRLDGQSLQRLHFVTPIEVVKRPLYSRWQYVGIAIALGCFFSLGVVATAEWTRRSCPFYLRSVNHIPSERGKNFAPTL